MEDAASYDTARPEKPEMLKILCILSFVSCGLLILIYTLGSTMLLMDPETIMPYWEKMAEQNPAIGEMEPATFLSTFGTSCIYLLILTIVSLVGVIMMWRLERAGFFVYAIAELAGNFVNMFVGSAMKQSVGGLAFWLVVDLVFIGLYFTTLKYMKKGREGLSS